LWVQLGCRIDTNHCGWLHVLMIWILGSSKFLHEHSVLHLRIKLRYV
jgi:hypothetical protein